MAASKLKIEVTCSICQDIYTDPVTLTCGHSFCRPCIKKTFDNQQDREYFCPECMQRFMKPPDLKKNPRLSNIAEHFLSTSFEKDFQSLQCSYCVGSFVPAVIVCLHCEAHLCDVHKQTHNKSPEHILAKPTTSLENRKCSVHHKVMDYYCTVDATCICAHCLASTHKGHDVEFLMEAFEQKKEKLSHVYKKLNTRKQKTEDGLQALEKNKGKYREKATAVKDRVTSLLRDIKKELEGLERRVKTEMSRQEMEILLPESPLRRKKEELHIKILDIEKLYDMTDPLLALQTKFSEDYLLDDEKDSEYITNDDNDAIDDLDDGPILEMLCIGLSYIMAEATKKIRLKEDPNVSLCRVLTYEETPDCKDVCGEQEVQHNFHMEEKQDPGEPTLPLDLDGSLVMKMRLQPKVCDVLPGTETNTRIQKSHNGSTNEVYDDSHVNDQKHPDDQFNKDNVYKEDEEKQLSSENCQADPSKTESEVMERGEKEQEFSAEPDAKEPTTPSGLNVKQIMENSCSESSDALLGTDTEVPTTGAHDDIHITDENCPCDNTKQESSGVDQTDESKSPSDGEKSVTETNVSNEISDAEASGHTRKIENVSQTGAIEQRMLLEKNQPSGKPGNNEQSTKVETVGQPFYVSPFSSKFLGRQPVPSSPTNNDSQKRRLSEPLPSSDDDVLDVTTAHNSLDISQDGKAVRRSTLYISRPEMRGRFLCPQVLGTKGFSSGVHFWDLEIRPKTSADKFSMHWTVGVSYPSIDRRDALSVIGYNRKSWGLHGDWASYSVIHNNVRAGLVVKPSSHRVRVEFDYEHGLLSFYELHTRIRHLHNFYTKFTEPLHLIINLEGNGWARIRSRSRAPQTP